MCNLKVPSEWLSVMSFYNPAIVQLHNVCALNTEGFDCLCCSKISVNNFDTATKV